MVDERRRELLVELLRLSSDPTAIGAAWEGVRGTGQAIPIRPHEPRCLLSETAHAAKSSRREPGNRCTCWIRHLDELERALARLKQQDRACWYAVIHRYRLCTRRPTIVQVRGGRPQLEPNQQTVGTVNRLDLNRRGDGTSRMLVETWRAGLNPEFVGRGLDLLAGLFQGQPELPLDIYKAA